jgi:outer membrane protein TolC
VAAALGATVQGLLDHARAHNPELAGMRAEADAAGERVQPAGALPDPMVRLELMDINNLTRTVLPTRAPSRVGEVRYTLLQSLPAWGKRDLRRSVAEADVQQAGARTDVVWAELATKIKTGYAQYFQAAGSERLTQEVVDLMQRLAQLAQSRYASGLAGQQDALRAQLELTAMRAELIELDNNKRQLRARLNAWLARDTAAPLADPAALRPLPELSTLDAPTLVQRARQHNPQLRAEEAALLAAQRKSELTLRNRSPDLQVGVSPTQMGSRITSWAVMLEMNIPLQQGTRRAEEREAEAMVSAARARQQAAANGLLGELGEQLAGIESARRSEALITTQLLPQSELNLRSALAAYESGKLDFAAVLDAQRQSAKARQDRLKVQTEAQMRLAEIERIVGEDL